MKITDPSIDSRPVRDRSTNGIVDQATQRRRLPAPRARPRVERTFRLAVNMGADVDEVGAKSAMALGEKQERV